MHLRTSLTAALVFMLAVAASGARPAAPGTRPSTAPAGATVRASADGRVQATFPAGWQPAELAAADAQVRMSHRARDAHALVISEAKADVAADSVEAYGKIVLDAVRKKGILTDIKVSEPQKLTVNGCRAVRYEMTAVNKDTPLAYVRTYVETPTRFNQVILWTTASRLEENRADFTAIVASFRENAPTTAPAAPPRRGR